MKKIAAYLRPYLGRMSLGLLIKFIGTIMDLLLPWILATTIDHVVPTKSIPAILLWGGMMVVCSVGGSGGQHRRQPHGLPVGAGHHPADSARFV